MADRQTVNLSDLVIWTDNPRHGLETANRTDMSEKDVINILIDTVGHIKMLNLIKDIFAAQGLRGNVNPIVVGNKDKYFVYDGNRRISSLKIIKTPTLVESENLRLKIQELVADADVSFCDKVFVYITDEKEALETMDITHGGAQEGVGVIPWEAYQRDTSLAKRGLAVRYSAAYSICQVLNYRKQSDFPMSYTDMDRIFSSQYLRNFFNINNFDDSYKDELLDAISMLIKYRNQKRFKAFSREFHQIEVDSDNAPIALFCRWVQEQRDDSKRLEISAQGYSIYQHQDFVLDKIAIQICSKQDGLLPFSKEDIRFTYYTPSGRKNPRINTATTGTWKVKVQYLDISTYCQIVVKELLDPQITFNTSMLTAKYGSTVDLRKLILTATNGHGVNVKDTVVIRNLDGAKVKREIFDASNPVGTYCFSYSFNDITNKPFSVVTEIQVVDNKKALTGAQSEDSILSFEGDVGLINISHVVNQLVNEINALKFNENPCILASSLRSVVELSFDRLSSKRKELFTSKKLPDELVDFHNALTNGLLNEICSIEKKALSFQTEKNKLALFKPDEISAMLNLGAHKSVSQIQVEKLCELARIQISSILVYVSVLMRK